MSTATGIPDAIGDHRIEAVLGSGGMGTVFLARDSGGQAVALKVPHLGAPPAVLARFHREAAIRIDHPNVVRVVDSGLDAERPWIAFELLEGESLASRLRKGRIPMREVVDVALQTCRGLIAAHRVGVVHRDLKPDNIFCCTDGTVKVLDFGIARVAADMSLTAEGAVVGTLAYLAPEQARGEPRLDRRVDVWALGVILYEALTGAPPFARATVVSTLMAILHDPIPSLAGVVRPRLAAVVAGCLARAPSERFGDATELLEALASVELDGSSEVVTGEIDAATMLDASAGLRPDEQRVVVVLLARGVRDREAMRRDIERAGGEFFPLLGHDAIGLFGGRRTEGDELERAVEAGLACRFAADRVAVGSGRAWRQGETLTGGALEEAQAGCDHDVSGVVIAHAHVAALSRFHWRAVGDVACEVLAPLPASSFPPAPSEPLLSREVELLRLRDLSRRTVEEGRATVARVIGPSGIGKSRLCRWLIREWERRGHGILVGEASPREAGAAGSFIGEMLEADRDPRLEDGTVVDGAPSTDARWAADRLRLAFIEHLDARASLGPLLVVIDDAQWVDPTSREILAAARERLADRPVLFAATARQRGESDWLGANRSIELRLQGLDLGATSALIARTAGHVPSETICERVRHRTEGNPLFIQHLVLGGGIDTDSSADLPSSIESAVQARLDRLGALDKEACKAASVLGRPFDRHEVGPAYQAHVDGLVAEEILRVQENGRVAFVSELTRDVAYRMIAPEVRQRMHAEVAERLAAGHHATPEELAHHYDAAGDVERAAAQHARAAIRATSRGDPGSVLSHADRALELGVAETAGDLCAALHLARADAFNARADRSGQDRALDDALAAARTPAERSQVEVERVLWLAHVGRTEEALQLAQRILDATAEDDPDAAPARVVALGRRGELLGRLGRYGEATESLERAADEAVASPPHLRARVEEWTGLVASYRGDLGTAMRHFDRALRLYRLAADPRRAAGMEANVADALNRVGEHEAAAAALETALTACRAVGYRAFEAYVLDNLGYAMTGLGRLGEAIETLERAEAVASLTGVALAELVARLYRAHALTLAGRQAEAEALARSVADDAKAAGRPGYAALAWARAAEAAHAAGALERALDLSARALALRDELGGTPEDEACVFAIRAQALDAAGERERARKVRARGAERLREVASAIADPKWRERFLEGPTDHRALLPR